MIRKLLLSATAVLALHGTALAVPAGISPPVTATATSTQATGTSTLRSLASRAADLVNVKDGYGGAAGAKGDGQIASPSVTIAAGSTSLVAGTATFTAADVGKVIVVAGAGVAPASGPVETIPVTAPGAGYTAVPSCALADGAGTGSGGTCAPLMALQSATVASAGAGCLASSTLDMVVAIDGTGTPARIGVTTNASGAVTGVASVVAPGLVSALGNLTAAPAYGGNCTTAPTFALSYGVAAVQVTALGAAYSTAQTTAALSGGSPTTAATLGAPVIGAPVPPLVTTIVGVASPTQVTLAAPASTALSGVTKLLWATDDRAAFQGALSSGSGIWVPAGIYWIGGTLDPGLASTIRGEGMQATVLAFDSGTSTTQDTGNWTPLLKNTTGSPGVSNGKGTVQLEDLQVRGLLDFGRVNTGGAGLELNNYAGLHIDRVKFFQIPFMAMQPESIRAYSVTNSVFDYVLRDQARCRSCFGARVIGNRFSHSDDDSVALHQAAYVQGPGLVHEGDVVEGNDFEDTTGVHILGARTLIVRGNTFRRMKVQAIAVNSDPNEGINQQHAITVADNTILDMLSRNPVSPAGAAISIAVAAPNAPSGITTFLPGANASGTAYFGKPWDYEGGSVVAGAAFAPAARGLDVHDNTVMRTLPAVARYSAWGFGPMLSVYGAIDPAVPEGALRPTAGIVASVNTAGLSIHHNDVSNVRRGIMVQDNVVSPAQVSLSITFNHVFDAWEYGIGGLGTGTVGTSTIVGNDVDADPYGISPGRAGVHGAWTSGYALSKCFSTSYGGTVDLSLNTFSNCYTVQTGASWVISHNIVKGSVYSGTTGQPGYSTVNYGIGAFPSNIGEQFYIAQSVVDPSASSFGSLGSLASGHPTSAAALPTSGFHVTGDFIWSTAPATCTCQGWLALTTGTAWTAGTDFKVVGVQ